jgi:hypothetical protein
MQRVAEDLDTLLTLFPMCSTAREAACDGKIAKFTSLLKEFATLCASTPPPLPSTISLVQFRISALQEIIQELTSASSSRVASQAAGVTASAQAVALVVDHPSATFAGTASPASTRAQLAPIFTQTTRADRRAPEAVAFAPASDLPANAVSAGYTGISSFMLIRFHSNTGGDY